MIDLSIKWDLVLLTAFIFFIMIFILNNILYKPMLNFIDERNAKIKKDEDSANKNILDLEEYENEIKNIISNAKKQAIKIKQEAVNNAKEKARQAIESKQLELNNKQLVFDKNLQEYADDLRSELKSKIPDLNLSLRNKIKGI